MASGRRGCYRDNWSEDFVSDLGMLRKDFGNFNDDYGRMRNRDHGRGQNRDSLHHRVRVAKKDIEEREESHSGYNSTRDFSDLGHLSHTTDREPGELSSDDSDGAIDSSTALNKEIGFNKLDNEIQLFPAQNRRKLSPIVWERDDRDVGRPVKRRHISISETAKLPPQPPIIKSHHQSPNSNPSAGANIRASPSDDTNVCVSEVSPFDKSSPLPKEHCVSKVGRDTTDHDYVPVRTVMSSRWVNDAESPADEGEIFDYEDTRITSRNSGSGSNEVMVRKSISPELGEIERRVRSSSRDSYADNSDKNYYVKIDDGRNHVGTCVSESDSKFDGADQQPNRSLNMLQSCRYVDEFDRLNEINEGTYGVVSRAKDKKTGEIVALKRVKMEKEREGFPTTSLREINILLSLRHPSIVDVKEVVMGRRSIDCIYMVMEYMEHDLKGLLETIKQPFSQSEVKCLLLQLLRGVKYLHDNWVIHRDLKTSNLLFDNRGNLKICDFGMARQYGSPLKPYTPLVVTLWYRAPEILLGAKQYSTAIDMWSVGCIMAELLSKEPLFIGKNELDQLDKIFRVLGPPNETIWPGCTKLPGYKVNFVRNQYNLLRKKFPATSFTGSPVLSDAGYNLLSKLLTYDPEKRITAEAALNHEWFREVPLPKSKEFMPTYPSQNDQDRRMRRVVKRRDPFKEQWRKELQQGELGTGGTFHDLRGWAYLLLLFVDQIGFLVHGNTSCPTRHGLMWRAVLAFHC